MLTYEEIKELDEEYGKIIQEMADRLNAEYQPDREDDHISADSMLCYLLSEVGFEKVVNAFNDLPKWYA